MLPYLPNYAQYMLQKNTRFMCINEFILEACHICTASLNISLHGNVNNSKLIKNLSLKSGRGFCPKTYSRFACFPRGSDSCVPSVRPPSDVPHSLDNSVRTSDLPGHHAARGKTNTKSHTVFDVITEHALISGYPPFS